MASLGAFIKLFSQPTSPAEFVDRPAGLWPAQPEAQTPLDLGTIASWQSPMEPTLPPGEWERMTVPERAERTQGMLAGTFEAAAMAGVPGVGPRGPIEMRAPGARVRSVHEEAGAARGRSATIGDLATAESRLQSGQFVRSEDVPLNRNRYLAVYGEPDAKVRNRGGKPIEYAVQPQAEAVRLERDGKPYFVGKLTPEQWLEKQQSWVGPEGSKEWNEARGWYKSLLSEFTQVYGTEAAPAMLSLWGLSQQRASPSAGMSHVLKAQDIAAGWRTEMEGLAGLAHDRLMKAIRTGDSDVGEKLADFADAVRGKTTRQWTGDDPRTGQPAPFDVHASRDVGFIDDTTRSGLAKHFGPEVAARFPVDMKGAPSPGQYAYGSKYYNGIKDALNARLEPGQAPYTADEVQAIGWVGHQNMTGASPEGPGNIFQSESKGRSVANISRVAVEAAPGEGSPLMPAWEAIPEAKRAEATYRILNEHAGSIADTVGVKLRRAEPTVGVWQQYSNPNVTFEVVGTPDGALRFAQGMAYAAGQSEVWAHQSVIRDRANAFAMDIKAPESFDLTKPAEVTRFWSESGLAQVPGLGAAKIQARDGDHRIRVIFDRDPGLSDAARQDGRDFDTLASAAKLALEASPLEGWSYRAVPLGLRKSVHDWKGDASGQGHLRGLDRRPGAVAELDRIARRVAESYRREGAGQAGAESEAGVVAVPDSAQGLTLRQLIGQPPPGGGLP